MLLRRCGDPSTAHPLLECAQYELPRLAFAIITFFEYVIEYLLLVFIIPIILVCIYLQVLINKVARDEHQ